MVTIEVDEEVWRDLTVRKNPGDSFNDVLRRVLDMDDVEEAEHPERADSGRESGAAARARDALADWDPQDVDSQKARDAVCAVVGWLAAQDAPQQRAAVLDWAERNPAATPYAASTLWDKVAQPGLAELESAGVVARTPNVGYEIVDES